MRSIRWSSVVCRKQEYQVHTDDPPKNSYDSIVVAYTTIGSNRVEWNWVAMAPIDIWSQMNGVHSTEDSKSTSSHHLSFWMDSILYLPILFPWPRCFWGDCHEWQRKERRGKLEKIQSWYIWVWTFDQPECTSGGYACTPEIHITWSLLLGTPFLKSQSFLYCVNHAVSCAVWQWFHSTLFHLAYLTNRRKKGQWKFLHSDSSDMFRVVLCLIEKG